MGSSQYNFFQDITVAAVGDSGQGTATVSMLFELLNISGNTVLDSASITITLNYDMMLDASSSSYSLVWEEIPVIHLYEDGVLPQGEGLRLSLKDLNIILASRAL